MNIHMLIITLLVVSGFITLSLAVYAFQKLESVGARTYIFLILSISIYSLGYAFELYNTSIEGILFALKIEYIGIAFLPVFWFILALKYTGYDKIITPLVHMLLFIIPIFTIILLYTNNYHFLYYREIGVNREGLFPLAAMKKGIWFYINSGYTNLLILSGTLLFARMMFKKRGNIRKQAMTMLFISLIPWAGNILYLAGLSPHNIDLTPFFLTITGPLFAMALFKYGMFDITPIARDTIFEEMKDIAIVLDDNYRIADFNKSTLTAFPQFADNVIGTLIDKLIAGNSELLDQIYSDKNKAVELVIKNESGSVYYNSLVTELYSKAEKKIGKIITFHDISIQKIMQEELHNLATTDELTSLYNRRHFIKASKNELKRSKRYKHQVSFLLIDLDYFKKVNDTYGHPAGDEVLIQVAKIFIETLRDNDIVARYGGEEFTAILPEVDGAGAYQIADRLRANIDSLFITYEGNEIHITVSIGVSTCLHERATAAEKNDMLLEELLSEADKALYKAKEDGRNKVVVYKNTSV